MTRTRWLIVGFWVLMAVLGIKAFYDFNGAVSATPRHEEKHWFPPPLPGSQPALVPDVADVRLVHYVPRSASGVTSFTVDVTVKNFGQKKATGIQVRIQPYIGTGANNSSGPEGIPQYGPGGDPMASIFQWLTFPDLAPGATATQTITLPMRSDATPAGSFKPQIVFQTVNP